VPKLVFFIALALAPFTAAMALVIAYAEYAKHLVDRGKVLKTALRMALVTLLFFLTVPPFLIWQFLVVPGHGS
jgi:hypothetical protein